MKRILTFLTLIILTSSLALAGTESPLIKYGGSYSNIKKSVESYSFELFERDYQDLVIDNLKAYPNPFSVKTTISFESDGVGQIEFEVKNILGVSVFKRFLLSQVGTNTFTFQRNGLDAGMYIYQIKSSENIIAKRFVIK